MLGSSSYLAVRPEHDGLEIGWTWLHPSAWRSGANLEAKLLMLRLAFEQLGACGSSSRPTPATAGAGRPGGDFRPPSRASFDDTC